MMVMERLSRVLPKVTPRTKQLLLVELRTAIQVWLVLYGVLFVALLGYRYNTQRYYYSKQQLQLQQQAMLQFESSSSSSSPEGVGEVVGDPILQQYQGPIQSLLEELRTAQNLVQSKLEVLDSHRQRLETMMQQQQQQQDISQEDNDDDIDVDTATSLEHWQRLMTTAQLQQHVEDEDLDALFHNAFQELNVLLAAAASSSSSSSSSRVDWGLVQRLWNEVVLATTHHRQPRDYFCPSKEGVVAADPSQDTVPIIPPEDVATQQDLQHVLQTFDKLFSNRNSGGVGVQALLPETRKAVEDWTLFKADKTLQDIAQAIEEAEMEILQEVEMQQQGRITTSSDNSNDNGGPIATKTATASSSSCDVNLDMVTALVDAGLKAMAAQKSVRDALQETLQQFDPSTEIILDADLPPAAASSALAGAAGEAIINLRDAIESPLLIKSIDWIDDLVDLVGGYSDKLDQYLDSVANRNSVGEVVVETLLKKAGLVNVNVQELGDKMKVPPSIQRKVVQKFG